MTNQNYSSGIHQKQKHILISYTVNIIVSDITSDVIGDVVE